MIGPRGRGSRQAVEEHGGGWVMGVQWGDVMLVLERAQWHADIVRGNGMLEMERLGFMFWGGLRLAVEERGGRVF